jgi:hypothetical protein
MNDSQRTTRVSIPNSISGSEHARAGETVEITFPDAGSFLVFAAFNPKMELRVDIRR